MLFFAYFLFVEKKVGTFAFLVLLLFTWKVILLFFAYFLFVEKKVGRFAFLVLLLFTWKRSKEPAGFAGRHGEREV